MPNIVALVVDVDLRSKSGGIPDYIPSDLAGNADQVADLLSKHYVRIILLVFGVSAKVGFAKAW